MGRRLSDQLEQAMGEDGRRRGFPTPALWRTVHRWSANHRDGQVFRTL